MTKSVERLALPSMSPGTERFLHVHRYGKRGARPKAYIHAALHSDEIPAILAAHHLIRLLDAADGKGEILGEILVLPVANPIGLGQIINGLHAGRHELRGGGNFNRNWPDLSEGLAEQIKGKLGADAAGNIAAVRQAIGRKLDRMQAGGELAGLRIELLRLAYDSDIVLDIHCDDDALLHLFMLPEHWTTHGDLAAELGARACLCCADSRASSFDEANSTPYSRLRAVFGPDIPLPSACFAATVELRGQADAFDRFAEADAKGLYRFLQRKGLIAGDPGPLPSLICDATALEATDILRAPRAGIIAYQVELGQQVKQGDLIAEIVDPLATDQGHARAPVRATTDGFILSRCLKKLVAPGDDIAKIVGREILPHRKAGNLLSD